MSILKTNTGYESNGTYIKYYDSYAARIVVVTKDRNGKNVINQFLEESKADEFIKNLTAKKETTTILIDFEKGSR
jgi:hypothetical protein